LRFWNRATPKPYGLAEAADPRAASAAKKIRPKIVSAHNFVIDDFSNISLSPKVFEAKLLLILFK
jgi:hypothetical protein